MSIPAGTNHFFSRLAAAWGILLVLTLVVTVIPLWRSNSNTGMVQGDSTIAREKLENTPELPTTGNTTEETTVAPDGTKTTVTTIVREDGTETKSVTTNVIVGGATVDPEVSRFIKTFDGFRSDLREIGLAKGVYSLIERFFGFLHTTTGVATPEVSDQQQ